MDWNKGYSALYELRRVDPVSWGDAGSCDFTDGSISRSEDDLQESADIGMTEDPGECWLRVYLKARQTAGGERVAVFTGLASTPQRTLDGNNEKYRVICYSVLKPADDVLVPLGFYVPSGADGARIAADLLSVGPAPVTYMEDGPRLSEAIVAEEADTNLSIAQKIVSAIGWRIRIAGNGSISVEPRATDTPSATFDTQENDSIELQITDAQDWYSVPNCLRASAGGMSAVARDDDPDNALSTVSRQQTRGGNGEIWASESSATLGDGESIAEYALRRLKELQSPARIVSYTRRFRPDVTVGDLVRLHLPGQKIDGLFRVQRQTITLGHGARTQEEVTYERNQ